MLPTAPPVGGLFFPQNQALGLDHSGFSPRVQQKIVHAGVNGVSYQQASRDLAELSDLKVAPKPVERLVRRIGQERIDQRDELVCTVSMGGLTPQMSDRGRPIHLGRLRAAAEAIKVQL